ncbi:MAG: dynamin family protein, partial [Planctomycetota bacterium]|nr:dynamin family protein [Planctomycetota bacterium]
EAVDPLAQRLMFDRVPDPGARRGRPMVLVIGNHSSGKSTLINYLLGGDVQATGVAPTDDGFTVLTFGSEDDEKDGAALVGNPEKGFADLEQFGPTLVGHLKLKVRTAPILKRLTLVDSPGMIDSAQADIGRGYDFVEVVRWFAEQADVVLLLFDPEKPGTTGETLTVLTAVLAGLDHKVIYTLNKVDCLESIHDFSKAYGALCWNLAKAIPRKDVPRIHTMYVPGPWTRHVDALPLDGFDQAREEVIQEIRRAPHRRVDNILTRLHDQARRLRTHAMVLNAARTTFKRTTFAWRSALVLIPLAFLGTASLAGVFLGREYWQWIVGQIAVGGILGVALKLLGDRAIARTREEVTEGLTGIFEHVHKRELAVGDEADLRALWAGVRDRTRATIETLGLERVPRTRQVHIDRLDEIAERRVPAMRTEFDKLTGNLPTS